MTTATANKSKSRVHLQAAESLEAAMADMRRTVPARDEHDSDRGYLLAIHRHESAVDILDAMADNQRSLAQG